MKIIVPDYYQEFHCIADHCKHTCCQGWEVSIDEKSLKRYEGIPEIYEKIEQDEDAHFRLSAEEVCPFLMKNGLCQMFVTYGEDMLCQTCTDHPRFRNFWEDRVEMGLGLVCEEAARLVLSKTSPMKLIVLSEEPDEVQKFLPEDEEWLLAYRQELLDEVRDNGPIARLKEYLIYRHIPDALYDDRLEERKAFVDLFVERVKEEWIALWKRDEESEKELLEELENKDLSAEKLETLVEIVRRLSYDLEYDEEMFEALLEMGYLK